LSRFGAHYFGNGKRHRTPSPAGIRKIKRVSFEVFLRLKELLYSVKVNDSITPRGNRKKSIFSRSEPDIEIRHCAHEYEPSNAINVRDSAPWQWRRVNEWHRYINDPFENIINGHMITE
jgi:hypothetical protein